MRCSRSRWAVRVAVLLALVLVPAWASPQSAPDTPPAPGLGAIRGTVTTQSTVPLAGVTISILSSAGNEGGELATATSENDGTFRVELAAGRYRLAIIAQGFDTLIQPITVVTGQTTPVVADLKIAAVAETVDVVAAQPILPNTGTLTASEGLTSRELEELTGGGGLAQALRLLVSVIEVPGGVSIKGGRPSQASVQLGAGLFVDPATGLSPVSFPDDAIDSVTVLPNPYAVEYGRFSSGLVLIRTRKGSDRWKTRLNNLDPSFRTKRGEPLHPIGVQAWSPTFEVGGPIVADKMFLQQAFQYRYREYDVASRPQDEFRTTHRVSSFTRLDANLSARHSLVTAAGFFPTRASQSNLGTFTPPEATVDMKGGVSTVAVTERALWTDSLISETTVEVHAYDTLVTPQQSGAMDLFPETTQGSFFNRQDRQTSTVQFVETVSGSGRGKGGLHLFKFGLDTLRSDYQGSSVSDLVRVRRSDGTLARLLDFGGAKTLQSVASTDLALFAQDRVQPTNRFYLEAGLRLDRDGVIDRFNLTPRVGSAVLLNEAGTSVIRAGYGLFFERTPSTAGVFEQFESPTETRFGIDGTTVIAPPARFDHVTAPDLRTSRSSTWDLAFDHRFNGQWSTHIGAIDRRGSHDLVVTPVRTPAGAELRLTSDARSTYREVELGVHYTGARGIDINASYVHSQARADYNAFTAFFDSILVPVIGENAYAPARTEIPHRLLARGRALPFKDWLVVGVLDWRTGLPYSLVDDALDFVGPRNAQRFPTYFRVDLGLEHRFKIGKFRPWIGVRADNALSSFLPSDVQNNVTSPAFGTFYNSEYRNFRIQVRFER